MMLERPYHPTDHLEVGSKVALRHSYLKNSASSSEKGIVEGDAC